MILAFLFVLFWLPFKILFRLKVVGKKNIPKKGSVILACNHFSNFDVILLQLNVGRRLFYLAKKELMSNKFVGWFLKKLGAFPVDRKEADLAATKFVLKTLNNGNALCLFPEGTRNKSNSGDLQALKSGVVLFSSKTNSPIVPMMFLKKVSIWHKNILVIGEPINFNFENNLKPTKEELESATRYLSETMVSLQHDGTLKYYKNIK